MFNIFLSAFICVHRRFHSLLLRGRLASFAGKLQLDGSLYPIKCVALSAENGHPADKGEGGGMKAEGGVESAEEKAEWGRIKGGGIATLRIQNLFYILRCRPV